MRRALLTLALAMPLMAACQLALPGRGGPVADANPITGGSITTTTLDAAPLAASADAPDPAIPPAQSASDPNAATDRNAATDAQPNNDTQPEARPTEVQPTEAAAPTAPVQSKSPSQIACEDDGGTWARAGDGGGMACIRQTRDGGKQCDSKSDCQGECLARSRTCAPIRPLFGCNAVLMDNGAEVNLCID
jgi:hypothetical protein